MTLRSLHWALLLPLFLLFAQQGELRHEYGHTAQAAKSCQKAPPSNAHCPLCLAYATLAGAAKTDFVAPTLLSHLAFHFAPAFDVASADGEAASPRSRGPPYL
jgi:hypothetical protein